ncbi:hypothetical protein F5Y10DRAFT_284912 [Nemania abortiva]|nr:hypothetical protein F5Y10DRAFT_284912 [Nemania abortiva]
MTYGYDSQVCSVKDITQRILYSQSKTLLVAVKHSRQAENARNRPLVFISHSLGGIIVKSALIYADRDDHIFRDIRLSTTGVVFFGTPHQGTRDETWTDIVSSLIRPKIDLDKMRNTLASDLNWLQFQLEQYKSLEGHFSTCCVYEDATTQSDSRALKAIPYLVATPLELLSTTSLLSTVPRRQLHEDLCKFQSRDSDYLKVMEQLVAMYKRSEDRVAKNIVLDKLRRFASDDRDFFYFPTSLLRHRVNPFLGRATELRTVHSYMKTQHLLTLFGPIGIGKTQIALEYAYLYKQYYHSVFWVDARNRYTLHSSLLKIAEQLKDHYAHTPGDEDRLLALHNIYLRGLIDEDGRVQSCRDCPELLFLVLRKWLERPGSDRWLVIVDGADRETDLRDFYIDEFFNSSISGRVIVTSRTLRRGQTLEIQELEQNDAAALLCETAQLNALLNNDILDLVNKLGRLPLAIKLAGAFLSSSNWSILDYTNSLSLKALPELEITTQSSYSMLQDMWSISVQQLDKETAELLNRIAFLSDNNISIDFIKGGIHKSTGSRLSFHMDESLRTLKKYSLVRYDSAAATVALDSEMLRWLRESKRDAWDDYKSRAKMACESVLSYLESTLVDENSVTYTAKQYRLEEKLLPHIERCVDYIQILSPNDAEWGKLGNICRRQGRHDLAKQYYEIIAGGDRSTPLGSGALLRDMHDMECALGPAHIRTLGAAVLLASQYQEEDEHAKAEIIWRRVNSSQSKTLGDFHPLTLNTAARLAMTLQQQGNYGQAKAIYSSTCTATARVIGDDHPDSLRLMVNIAVLCTLERRFEEASQEYMKVLEKMERKFGTDHEDVKRIKTYMDLNNKERQLQIG